MLNFADILVQLQVIIIMLPILLHYLPFSNEHHFSRFQSIKNKDIILFFLQRYTIGSLFSPCDVLGHIIPFMYALLYCISEVQQTLLRQ